MSEVSSTASPNDGLPLKMVIRLMGWPLIITYAFLPLTFLVPIVDSTREPYFDLSSPFAITVYWIAESCSKLGAPIVGALMLLLLITREGIPGNRRIKETILVVLAVALFGGGGSYLNENVIKVGFKAPRPNIVFLSGPDGTGPLGMSPDQFYETGDKVARQKPLRDVLNADTTPVDLSPSVRAHWINTTGYSFPSGHSTAAMFLATLFLGLGVSYVLPPRRRLFYLMLPWAVAVCYSRPILRVHTPLDITVGGLQGIVVGFVALVVVRTFLNAWQKEASQTYSS